MLLDDGKGVDLSAVGDVAGAWSGRIPNSPPAIAVFDREFVGARSCSLRVCKGNFIPDQRHPLE